MLPTKHQRITSSNFPLYSISSSTLSIFHNRGLSTKEKRRRASSLWYQGKLWPLDWVSVCERERILRGTEKVKWIQSQRKTEKRGRERGRERQRSVYWPLVDLCPTDPVGRWGDSRRREVREVDIHTHISSLSHTFLFIVLVCADTDRHAAACSGVCVWSILSVVMMDKLQAESWQRKREATHTFCLFLLSLIARNRSRSTQLQSVTWHIWSPSDSRHLQQRKWNSAVSCCCCCIFFCIFIFLFLYFFFYLPSQNFKKTKGLTQHNSNNTFFRGRSVWFKGTCIINEV